MLWIHSPVPSSATECNANRNATAVSGSEHSSVPPGRLGLPQGLDDSPLTAGGERSRVPLTETDGSAPEISLKMNGDGDMGECSILKGILQNGSSYNYPGRDNVFVRIADCGARVVISFDHTTQM